jgi:hypothetical protein
MNLAVYVYIFVQWRAVHLDLPRRVAEFLVGLVQALDLFHVTIGAEPEYLPLLRSLITTLCLNPPGMLCSSPLTAVVVGLGLAGAAVPEVHAAFAAVSPASRSRDATLGE